MNQQQVDKEGSLYSQLLNEAHQQGLEEIFTQILLFPDISGQKKALVWARVKIGKASFSALAEAESLEKAEETAKIRALSEALNKPLDLEAGQYGEQGKETGNKENKAPIPSTPEEFEPMSEAQRRYLLRLLAQQGIKGEPAYEKLKELFNVDSLKKVSKSSASQKIQAMLNSQESAQYSTGGKKT